MADVNSLSLLYPNLYLSHKYVDIAILTYYCVIQFVAGDYL